MANLIVGGAQWGDEGKGPHEAPHVAAGQPVCLTDCSLSEGQHG